MLLNSMSATIGRQKFLDELAKNHRNSDSEVIRLLNWNIRNPSLERAIKQIEWIKKNNFDVIVLSETKSSEGCDYISDRLKGLGYAVLFPKTKNDDYCAIMAVRNLKEIPEIHTDFLPYRVSFSVCNFSGKNILVAGMYAPIWKDDKARNWFKKFEELMNDENLRKKFSDWIIIGDMNVLEPKHDPQYQIYKEWEWFYNAFKNHGFTDIFRFFHPEEKEYSWFSHDGNGYRFDHAFATESLLPFVKKCFYIHEVRLNKLSDHSAMCLEIGKAGI